MEITNKNSELLKNIEMYEHDGWTIVKDLVPQKKLKELRTYLIDVMIAAFGDVCSVEKTEHIDLDIAFNQLDLNSDEALDIIKIAKNSIPFLQIITHEQIVRVVKQLQKSKTIHCVHDIAQFRIDPCDGSRRTFDWHQDYPYNQTSNDAITAWIPITKVESDMGLLRLIPSSHKMNVSIEFDKSKKKGVGDTNKILKFHFEQNMVANEIDTPEMFPGDVLFFHSKLLHKSGNNMSEGRSRWVCNPRYSNSVDKELVDRKWLSVNDRNVNELIEKFVTEGLKI